MERYACGCSGVDGGGDDGFSCDADGLPPRCLHNALSTISVAFCTDPCKTFMQSCPRVFRSRLVNRDALKIVQDTTQFLLVDRTA